MRNLRGTRIGPVLLSTLAVAVGAIGCAAPADHATPTGTKGAITSTPTKPQAAAPAGKPLSKKEAEEALTQAYASFARKDYDGAMAGAQRVLAGNASGPGAAEAHYLRGRVLEERAIRASEAKDIPTAKSTLQSAREAYNAAMQAAPAANVEGNVRAGIANVAYFQEDYATAIGEGTAAYEKIADPVTKSWVLYRVGLSQQRFGAFAEADRTFAAVQQAFPNSEPAKRAGAHMNARGFHVQVGTFTSPANADTALAGLRADGVVGVRLLDGAGRNVVRVGPVQTYDQAKTLKARLASKYPDALIVP